MCERTEALCHRAVSQSVIHRAVPMVVLRAGQEVKAAVNGTRRNGAISRRTFRLAFYHEMVTCNYNYNLKMTNFHKLIKY